MATLVVLPRSLTGTAPHKQSKAGSPVLTVATGTAGTHPTLVSLPCLTDVPASRVPTSTPSPRSGSHGSSYPPCVPTSAVVAGYESRFRTFNDRTSGALLGTHESRKERIYGHLRLIEPARGGWTTCPSRTAPRPIRPLAGCGRDTTVRRLPQAVIYSGKSSPRMVNLMCPFERMGERLAERRRQFLAIALSDKNFDEHERAFYDDMRDDQTFANTSSAKRKLARHIEQMEDVTDYTVRLAKAADLRIVNLDDERRRRTSNVVQLFPDQERA